MKGWRWLIAGLVCLGALSGCGGHDDNDMPTRFGLTALVSDVPGAAAQTDANLVNGWGVAFNPTGFVWVADNGTGKSTLYDGNGVPQSLVVSIPPGAAGDALPTGIVFSGGADFVVGANGLSGPSRFIFVSQAGTIAGWAPNVDRTNAITVVDGAVTGKSYLGLALAAAGTGNRLYATDFHNRVVDVYDGSFAPVALPGAFTDPALPAGYAPFGIQALGGRIYVTYAQQDAGGDEVKGAGLGIVDVYDTAGALIRRLVTGGPLNAPWGLALAPADFGTFSNALLVGNFGDGRINAFDANTGAFLGTLSDANGNPIVVDGLWGMAFGNGLSNQGTSTLFVAAGPSDESHGLYARIDKR